MSQLSAHLSNGYLKVFSFTGRASRSEFWTIYAANFAILLAGPGLSGMLPDILASTLIVLGIVAVSFGNLACAARRLHDTNRSGWWLASMIVPVMPFVVMYFLMQPSVSGPTRFDDGGGLPERTPDHFDRARNRRQPA